MVIGKCTDVFSFFLVGGADEVEGGGVAWEDLSMEKFEMGEENFNKGSGGFSSIITKKKKQ